MADPSIGNQQPPVDSDDDASDEDTLGINVVEGNADEEWEEWAGSDDGSGDGEPTRSLFDASTLPSPEAAMDHDGKEHGFDLRQFITQARLSDYGVIRVINYIRSEVAAGRNPRPTLVPTPESSQAPWDGDQYLIPTQPEDALLCYDYDEWTQQEEEAAFAADRPAAPSGSSTATQPAGSAPAVESSSEATALRHENRALQAEVAQLREALVLLHTHTIATTGLMQETGWPWQPAGTSTTRAQGSHSSDDSDSEACTRPPGDAGKASTSTQGGRPAGPLAAGGRPAAGAAGRRGRGKATAAQEVDDSYFDSYSGFNIHKDMLSDKPRTEAYRAALEGNPALIRDKVVLDVGCGTGILSLFACRGGAKHVVAVDGSERIAGFARQIATQAGYAAEAGGPLHITCSKLEELQALPGGVDKVDVIVSEWMGYALLFETMLDSVLAARDKWLAPGGVVLPDMATIYLAGANSSALGLDFWKDVYGFSMAPIASEVRAAQQQRANVLQVDAQHITTNKVTAKVLDLCTMKPDDQDFTCEFTLQPPTPSSSVEVAAVVVWFDMDFSPQRCPETPVKLSTAPDAPVTHWVQTVLPLRHPVTLAATPTSSAAAANTSATATQITGRLSMCRNRSKHRSLDISLEYSAVLNDGSTVGHTCIYPMSVLGD